MRQDWTLIQNRLQDAAAFMDATGKPGWAELANDALAEIRRLERQNAQLLEALTNIEKWTRQYAETSRDCAGSRIPVTGYKERLLLAANTALAAIKAAGG
jgi:hypothetical protein